MSLDEFAKPKGRDYAIMVVNRSKRYDVSLFQLCLGLLECFQMKSYLCLFNPILLFSRKKVYGDEKPD